MSKTWYPVINYKTCKECGRCINKCTHGVYDIARMPKPIVIYGEGCIQGCHGCGNLCPSGAITYIGENTDWRPRARQNKSYDTECECEGEC